MKNVYMLFIALLVVFVITACTDREADLDNQLAMIKSAENMTVISTMSANDEPWMTVTHRIDGDVRYTKTEMVMGELLYITETYTLTEGDDDVEYERIMEQGPWLRTTLDEPVVDDEVMPGDAQAEWFTYRDGVYELDPARVEDVLGDHPDEDVSVTITLEDDDLTLRIYYTMGEGDMMVEVVFQAFGSTVVELPDFSAEEEE